jgi:hypothetical protein
VIPIDEKDIDSPLYHYEKTPTYYDYIVSDYGITCAVLKAQREDKYDEYEN